MVEPVDMLTRIRGYNKKGTNIHMYTHGGKVDYITPFSMRIKRVLPVSPYKFQVFHKGAKERHLGEMSYIVLKFVPIILDVAIMCGGEMLFSVS